MIAHHRFTDRSSSRVIIRHCTAEGGIGQDDPRYLFWNATSDRRQGQARDPPWFCVNQPRITA
jgi:hypothetical protein